MFSRFWQELWIALFVLLVLIGIFSGHSLIIGLGAMGLTVAAISWLWNRLSLEEISYERAVSQARVFIGEEVLMTITLTNQKPVPLGKIRIEDELPREIEISEGDVVASHNPRSQTLRHSTTIGWYERIRWRYHITGTQRGFYRIGPARIDTGDLFGFFGSQKSVPADDFLLVYPKVVSLPELGLPVMRPLGETVGGIRIFEDPSRPMGLRDYQQGDPLKAVDWKASAKRGMLQTKTFEPSSTMTVVLVVVVETTANYWEGYSPINLERVITTAASVANYASEQRYNLGLFSNGTPILTDRPMKIKPSRSPEQLTIILEALATIRPLAVSPMAAQLAEYSRRFPVGATLVIAAALVTEELVEAMGNLNSKGHRVTLMYLGDDQCPQLSEGVLVHHLQGHFARMELANEFHPG